MAIDLDKVVASSYTAGLKEVGNPVESSRSASGTVGVGDSANFQINLPLPETDVIALAKAKITGTGEASIDGYWWPIQGQVYLTDMGNFLIAIIYTRTSTQLVVNFEFLNNTAGSEALPSMTLTARARFHTYPW